MKTTSFIMYATMSDKLFDVIKHLMLLFSDASFELRRANRTHIDIVIICYECDKASIEKIIKRVW